MAPERPQPPKNAQGRPYIGMHFKCCNVYNRIYLNESDMMFRGRCPRCGALVQIKARTGGSRSRFWTAE